MGYTAIVDYDVGNLKSVSNAMSYIGQKTLVTGEAAGLEQADAIILPGGRSLPRCCPQAAAEGIGQGPAGSGRAQADTGYLPWNAAAVRPGRRGKKL